METQNNGRGLAIGALVCGILGFVLGCFIIGVIPALIGLVLSFICLIKNTEGKGLAIAGLITALLGIIISCFFLMNIGALLEGLDNPSDNASVYSINMENLSV